MVRMKSIFKPSKPTYSEPVDSKLVVGRLCANTARNQWSFNIESTLEGGVIEPVPVVLDVVVVTGLDTRGGSGTMGGEESQESP
jgi:hypothetical protein